MTAAERREERRARRVLRRMDRSARRHASGASGAGGAGWVAVAVLAVVVGLAAHERGWAPADLADLVHPRVFVEIEGRAVAVPRPEESTGRVLPAVAVTTSGSHAFLHTTESGAPVGYDPCRPVRYVVASQGVPASGQQLVADAVAIVSAASGLALVDAGTTEELPVLDRALIQEDRYGPGWAPVLIAWADETTVPELAGQVAGVGGSAAVPGASGAGTWLAAGRLVLDRDDLTAMLTRADGYAEARAIVVHELAHVLGLDHVQDPGELMNPTTSTRTDLGPGDLAGLALVGQVACEE